MTPARAWIATDTLLSAMAAPADPPPAARVVRDAAEARAIEAGLFRAGPPTPAGTMRKSRVFARARVATAGLGLAAPLEAWFAALGHAGDGLEGVDELAAPDAAPVALARIQDDLARKGWPPVGLIVAVVGWSRARGRAVAWTFASGDGFAPRELADGHTYSPAATASREESPRLRILWERAAAGEGVDEFHLALGRVQARAWREGRSPVRVGGGLRLAEVDEAGARCRAVGEL